ncbi:OmpP1/FadL family transporter [Vibrio breoganii]|uniref:OmpP1/FadL family transporter n=1 Tax=Vibrio breoganii TaxID=553239 RepID=UPI001055693E|nr:outer membrane protein transport protein [Vibrio breoganii]
MHKFKPFSNKVIPFVLPPLLSAISLSVQATGLNFWESSSINSALASANGAKASDASVLALAPSSITQLDSPTVTANVTYYRVSTDYYLFGAETDYEQADPIPAGFFSMPVSDNWYLGLAIYSRTAADISVPQITLVPETRVRPITVSIAPTVAYRWNDASIGLTVESLQSQYLLEQEVCLIRCQDSKIEGTTSGWSGAISATWQVSQALSFAATHRLASQYSDANIEFDLPDITSLYATWSPLKNLDWHTTYSYTQWKNKGIRYTDYSDVIGLLVGASDSQRFATSLNYHIASWDLRVGLSLDEAIDAFGGNDIRYRVGAGYRFNTNWRTDIAFVFEDYARKEYNTNSGDSLVAVQNEGFAAGLGVTYTF